LASQILDAAGLHAQQASGSSKVSHPFFGTLVRPALIRI
jgi:hypothetical protein